MAQECATLLFCFNQKCIFLYLGVSGVPGDLGSPGLPGIPGLDGCNGTDVRIIFV